MTVIDQDLAARLVDAVNGLYGAHPGHRAAHAKGMYCRGTFTASADAVRLSRAQHFSGAPTPALVRFSNGSGDPASHDGAADGRGMAVQFELPDGSFTDIVALSLPVFFARTPEDFLGFTLARTPDPATGQLDMAKFMAFVGEHPEAGPAIQAALAAKPPASYAQCSYNSIHAFWLVDAAGTRRAVRYRWVPEAGEAGIDPQEATARDADYLRAELAQRLRGGSAAFTLTAALAADGDPVDDATAMWPEDRERVVLGRLEITGTAEDPERDGSILVFDPTRVTDGVETSDDPILHARAAAYSESVKRRVPA